MRGSLLPREYAGLCAAFPGSECALHTQRTPRHTAAPPPAAPTAQSPPRHWAVASASLQAGVRPFHRGPHGTHLVVGVLGLLVVEAGGLLVVTRLGVQGGSLLSVQVLELQDATRTHAASRVSPQTGRATTPGLRRTSRTRARQHMRPPCAAPPSPAASYRARRQHPALLRAGRAAAAEGAARARGGRRRAPGHHRCGDPRRTRRSPPCARRAAAPRCRARGAAWQRKGTPLRHARTREAAIVQRKRHASAAPAMPHAFHARRHPRRLPGAQHRPRFPPPHAAPFLLIDRNRALHPKKSR